jgi:hypothetical protein
MTLSAYAEGDQKIENKFTQSLEKVAQTIAKPKVPKYFHQSSI